TSKSTITAYTAISARTPVIAIHHVLFIGSCLLSYVFCDWYVLKRQRSKSGRSTADTKPDTLQLFWCPRREI
ncbi:MAG: hypothetical protein KAU52_04265, partial [Methanosarcinales archaeon]|nr:hypothetical protein [Methanosarcinales archaeon]